MLQYTLTSTSRVYEREFNCSTYLEIMMIVSYFMLQFAAEGYWPVILVPDIPETEGWYSAFLQYMLTDESGVYERDFNYSTCCTSESSLFNKATLKSDEPGVVTIRTYFSYDRI
ncbi:hypothetical protein J6590_036166 [Homalodisca vitripennis]|nr:hypothetical protein J6590_036166 [Homalodisca vitripennis]